MILFVHLPFLPLCEDMNQKWKAFSGYNLTAPTTPDRNVAAWTWLRFVIFIHRRTKGSCWGNWKRCSEDERLYDRAPSIVSVGETGEVGEMRIKRSTLKIHRYTDMKQDKKEKKKKEWEASRGQRGRAGSCPGLTPRNTRKKGSV